MKRIIRNRNTGLYLRENGAWTDDWRQAKQFENFEPAWEEKQKHGLAEVDLVLIVGKEPSPQYDVVLPLSDIKSEL